MSKKAKLISLAAVIGVLSTCGAAWAWEYTRTLHLGYVEVLANGRQVHHDYITGQHRVDSRALREAGWDCSGKHDADAGLIEMFCEKGSRRIGSELGCEDAGNLHLDNHKLVVRYGCVTQERQDK